MNTPPVPPPRKGPLILLGVAIGAIGILMVVLVFLGVVWVGFSAYRSHSVPAQPVPMQPQFDPLVAEPPGIPPPIVRRPSPDRMIRVERAERMDRAEITELPAPAAPGSVAPVLHLHSPSGNLLDGKIFTLETPGEAHGAGGYVRVADAPALRIPGPMSISVWFNARTTNNPMTICSRALNGPPWQFPYSSWLLRINDPIHLEGTLTGAGGYSPSTWISQPIKPGQWYHMVFTYDGRKKKLYLNGGQAMKLFSGKLDHTSPNTYTLGRSILIGADESESPVGEIFDGAIDDLRVFNRALPEEEILEMYSKPAPGREGGNGNR